MASLTTSPAPDPARPLARFRRLSPPVCGVCVRALCVCMRARVAPLQSQGTSRIAA